MNANTHLYVYTGGGAGLYMHTNTDTELTHVVSSAHIVDEAQRKGIALENIVFDADVALSTQMDVEYMMKSVQEPMKAVIVAANTEMHMVWQYRDGSIVERIYEYSLFPADAIADWANNLHADVYFVPNTRESLISEVQRLMFGK